MLNSIWTKIPQQHDDYGDDSDDDFCEETFGINDGWSAERSCFGKTSSFESPLRGISLSDSDDDANADEDNDDEAFWCFCPYPHGGSKRRLLWWGKGQKGW